MSTLSEAYQAIRNRHAFQYDIDVPTLLEGFEPEEEDLLEGILPSSIAHRVLATVVNYSEVKYALLVNGFVVAFEYPMGWAVVPKSSYSAGVVGREWAARYDSAISTVHDLIDDNGDQNG